MSLKPCLSLCSRSWLKPNRNIVYNFKNVLRNRLYEVELRIPGSNLFHSLITLGMKEFLKYLGLQETVLNELTCRRELLIDGCRS